MMAVACWSVFLHFGVCWHVVNGQGSEQRQSVDGRMQRLHAIVCALHVRCSCGNGGVGNSVELSPTVLSHGACVSAPEALTGARLCGCIATAVPVVAAVSLSFILSLARYNTYIFFCSNMGCGSYYLSS